MGSTTAFGEGPRSQDTKEGGKVGLKFVAEARGKDDDNIGSATACVEADPRAEVEEEGGKEGGE